MKSAILFVDDNENILQGLRRNLRGQREEWDMHFAPDGEAALKILAETPMDVVISDIRMPGIDGAELLRRVKELYPHTIRLVLSGQCDEESITTLLEVSHQYLAKPFETEALIGVVRPLLAVRDSLGDAGVKTFVTGLSALPSLPELHESIVAELRNDPPDAGTVENYLLRDISLVAKIFQVVNSSYFGASGDVNTVSYLWETLGVERIKQLVLNGHIIAPLEKELAEDSFVTGLWSLSLLTARISRLIAKAENMPQKACDKAWIAGLLHAIGGVILHDYKRKTGKPAGEDGAVVGSFLAQLWALPRDIGHVIRHHAAPRNAGDGDQNMLAIVHAARVMAQEKQQNAALGEISFDEDFLEKAGAGGKLESWRGLSATI